MLRLIAAAILLTALGCSPPVYDPLKATRPYPFDLHTANTVDIEVFRIQETLEIVNSTAVTYTDFDLWINQRFVDRIDALPAGETIRVSLWEFYDDQGTVFNAGGLWRTVEATPVRLIQIQPAGDAPLIGVIAIRAEEAKAPNAR